MRVSFEEGCESNPGPCPLPLDRDTSSRTLSLRAMYVFPPRKICNAKSVMSGV